MANRQHGRSRGAASSRCPSGSRNLSCGRNPSASRNATGSRPGRTVPISRSPAGGEGSAARQEAWTPSRPGTPAFVEPEVRRWPHPLKDETPPLAPGPEPALHYIRCALSYQNQLLADIKALLEQVAEETPPAAGNPLAADSEKA